MPIHYYAGFMNSQLFEDEPQPKQIVETYPMGKAGVFVLKRWERVKQENKPDILTTEKIRSMYQRCLEEQSTTVSADVREMSRRTIHCDTVSSNMMSPDGRTMNFIDPRQFTWRNGQLSSQEEWEALNT